MRARLALAVLAALVAPASAAAAVPDGTTVLLDRPSGLGALPFDGASFSISVTTPRALSADGCFAVFSSGNDVLFSGDDDAVYNVYRLDRCSPGHPLVLVSATATGAPGTGNSYEPSISADGRYVAFSSDAENLHPELPPGGQSTLIKDLGDGSVELASRADGASGAVPKVTYDPVIAGNGRAVTFLAYGVLDAANADGIAGENAAYMRQLDAGRTYMASVTSAGARGDAWTNAPAVPSHDGTAVALLSRDPLAAADDDTTGIDAYLVRGLGGTITTTLASYTAGNTSGAQSAQMVALSSDGLHVAYANNLVWETTCNPACTQANQPDFPDPGYDSEIEAVGFAQTVSGTTPVAPTRVFFTTNRPLLPGDTNDSTDMYARRMDYTPGSLTLLSSGTDAGGVEGASATDDGSVALFDSQSLSLPGTDGWNLQTFIRAGGQTTLISQPEGLAPRRSEVSSANISAQHAISASGRFVAFTSSSPFLGATLIGGYPSYLGFVRDVVSGVTTPVGVAPGGAPANGSVSSLTIDAAGERVAFVSDATNLVPGVTPGRSHLYLRDLGSGVTTLLDRAPGGAPLSAGVVQAAISGDGRSVAFVSGSTELPDAPPADSKYHAYRLEIASGAFTLVDRTAAGVVGNGDVRDVDVSADGRRVGLSSAATNLGGGTTGTRNAYVKDLDTGALTWTSIPQDGTTNHSSVLEQALSANGRLAAFSQTSAGFGYGSPDALAHVFVRNLDTGTTTLASAGLPAGDSQYGVSLSADGSRVAFGNHTAGKLLTRVYVRRLPAGPTQELVPGARLGSELASLNADGTCAALQSRSDDLVSPSFGPDNYHVFLRAFGGDCPASAAATPPPPGVTASDRARPVISRLSLTNRRFAVAKGKTAASARAAAKAKAKRGTTLRFTLSEPAKTVITIARKSTGRRSGGRCVKPARRLRKAKRCTRYVTVARLTRSRTRAGANRIAYTGRIGKRSLRPGGHRAALVATDAAGNRSAQRTVSFTVVRG